VVAYRRHRTNFPHQQQVKMSYTNEKLPRRINLDLAVTHVGPKCSISLWCLANATSISPMYDISLN
jgi:hypothetical protein